jgi:predicted ATPase/DNA-binding SARP family transcriptional activator
MLKLYLFGPPRIELDGKPLLFKRRKALALLIYLAVTGQPHSRDALATLFYPDLDQRRARSYFRRDLGALNTRLRGDWLTAHSDIIDLTRTAPVWIDIAEFRTCLAACHNHGHPNEAVCLDCLPLLTTAAELYTDHFLTGFSLTGCAEFDDWQLFEAENLRQELVRALDRLVTGHIAHRQYDRGLPHARRLLDLDPLHEAAHRHLMTLFALSGQEAAALRQYEDCISLLDEEFGAAPDEETTRLYEAIKTRRLEPFLVQAEESDEVSRARSSAGLPSQPTPQPLPSFLGENAAPRQASVPTDFVGRERALSHLAAALESARAGQGQILFVIGEAGRGKTMLVQEFTRQAQADDANLVVVTGYCDAITGIGDPYLPFREALTMLTGDVEAQWAGGLISQQQARQLWQLMPITLPALVQHAPDLIDSFVPGQALQERATMVDRDNSLWLKQLATIIEGQQRTGLDQNRIFAQYTAVLKAIAAQRPLLLIIEDLHWADTASSGLLFHLSREVVDSPILLVGTYRPEEVALSRLSSPSAGYMEQHPLANIVNELKRQHGDIWLDLGDLTTAEGRQFVDAYLDTQPNQLGEAFREALFQRTEGHALFTVELIRTMQERGDLRQDENGQWLEGEAINWTTLPVKVEGVIEKRIERLSEELQTILTIASVEGETFTAEVVARVQQLDQRTLVQQLSRELDKRHRLVTAQAVEWLDSDRQRLSRYRFRHNLFQHYLYDRLDEAERGYLHEAVGNALEQLYAGRTEEAAGRLARHFQIAGLVSKAIDYLQQAGDASAAVYANVEAAAHYTRALELINPDEADSGQLTSLYTRLGRAQELNSQFDQALATYEEMERLAQTHSNRSMELAALIHQGRLRCTTNPAFNPEQGEVLSEQGLALAQTLKDPIAEAKIHWNLLNLYRWTNRMQQAVNAGEQALALIGNDVTLSRDLRRQRAYTLNDLTHCYFPMGYLDKALDSSRQASDLWHELGDKAMKTDSLATAAYIHSYTGMYDQGITLSNEAWQISESISNVWGQSYSLLRTGSIYWERGRPEQAIAAMEDCLRLGELSGFFVPQAITRTDLAAVYDGLGDIERGLDTIRLALGFTETHLPFYRIPALSILAQHLLLQGNLAEAKAAIDQGKKDPYLKDSDFYLAFVLLADSKFALQEEDYDRALAVTDNLSAKLREYRMRSYIPEALYLQAQALRGLGQDEAARNTLLEARAEAEAMNARRPLWPILFSLSQLETDLTKAEHLRQQSQQIVEYIAVHTPTPELRASFLALPDVVAVFEPTSND